MSFSATLPSVDANIWGVWTQEDKDKYQKSPFYLVKSDEEKRRRYTTWSQLITDTEPWKPNLAEVMRQVIVEHSPIVRQEARPNAIQEDPTADIHTTRERTVEARLYSQEFFSPHFHFLPAFQDFMRGHLMPCRETLRQQIDFYQDFFYRTYIWDYAPYVYVVGTGLVDAPTGVAADGTSNKSPEWLAPYITGSVAGSSPIGQLNFQELYKAFNAFTEEVCATPYEGSSQPGGMSKPLDEKYCFVTSSRQWNGFIDDPWLKENRPLNMNIVTDAFRGDIFGRMMCKIEKYPMRMAVDANGLYTLPQPETYNAVSTDPDYNRTRMAPAYSRVDQAQVEVGFLVGGKHFRRISVGAPPEFFAGAASDPSKISGMQWSGQLVATRNFLIPKKDSGGTIRWDTNAFGRYVRFQALLALGIIGTHAFNVMPVIYRRGEGIPTTVLP